MSCVARKRISLTRRDAWLTRRASFGAGSRSRVERIGHHVAELTGLDAAIGDGDHGINLLRGFALIGDRLSARGDAGSESSGAELLRMAGTVASGGGSLVECAAAARRAADGGRATTETLEPTKGRASHVGKRSQGHVDPGATSRRS